MQRWRDAFSEAAPQNETTAVTIASGQTESLSGTIRGDVSFNAGSELVVAAGTALTVFGSLVADAPASVAIGEGATFYAAGAVDAGLTISLGSASTLDLAAQDLSSVAACIAGLAIGSVVDIVSGTITSAQVSNGVLILAQDGNTVGTLTVGSAGVSTVLAVPDPVDGTRLLLAAAMPTVTAAAAGTGTGETVRWSGGYAGQWSSAESWQTIAGGAAEAPSVADDAIVAGPSDTALMLAGNGSVGALSTSGIVALAGAFEVGLLQMGQSVADVLDLLPGATLQAATAELAAGILEVSGAQSFFAAAGTLSIAARGLGWVADGGALNAGAVLMQGGTARLDPTGTLTIGSAPGTAGTVCIGSGGTLTGFGAVRAPLINDGLVQASGGLLALYGFIGGEGTLVIDGASTLYAPYGAAAGQTMAFDGGASGTLELFATAATCAAAIIGVTPSDAIDIASATLSQASWTATGGTIGVLNLGDAGTLSVELASVYAGTTPEVALAPDSSGGTLIQIVPCFGAQSHLATPSGWRAADAIRPGMRVLTRSGAARRVRWVGRRDCTPAALWRHPELRPVRLPAGGVAGLRPRQDLLLSPQHGVLISTPLGARVVPAIALVDSQNVRRDLPPEGVKYVHIELDSHDFVLAEGVETESFLREQGDRQPSFQGAEGYPSCRSREGAPRMESGYGSNTSQEDRRGLAGALDQVIFTRSHVRISGWIFRSPLDTAPGRVAIFADGVLLGTASADRWRPDLDHSDLRDSRAGFAAVLPWSSSLRHRHLTVARPPPVTCAARVTGLAHESLGRSGVRLGQPGDREIPLNCPAEPPHREA
jgi:hypothetical protein